MRFSIARGCEAAIVLIDSKEKMKEGSKRSLDGETLSVLAVLSNKCTKYWAIEMLRAIKFFSEREREKKRKFG